MFGRSKYKKQGRRQRQVATPKRFSTPLWHFVLHAAKHRRLSPSQRKWLSAPIVNGLGYQIRLPEGLSFCANVPVFDGGKLQARRQKLRFEASFPPGANNAGHWQALAHGCPWPYALRVNMPNRERMKFWLLLTQENQPLAYLERTVLVKARAVNHDFMAFVPGKGGRGYGAQLLGNAVAVYLHAGLRCITLTAGLSAGSAVWPKMGFRPSSAAAWAGLKDVVRSNCRQLPATLHATFAAAHGRDLMSAVDAVLDTDDPDAIFDIVDIDEDDTAGTLAGLKHGLSGELLRGGHWHGVLDFFEGRGWSRFNAYINAKKVALPLEIA